MTTENLQQLRDRVAELRSETPVIQGNFNEAWNNHAVAYGTAVREFLIDQAKTTVQTQYEVTEKVGTDGVRTIRAQIEALAAEVGSSAERLRRSQSDGELNELADETRARFAQIMKDYGYGSGHFEPSEWGWYTGDQGSRFGRFPRADDLQGSYRQATKDLAAHRMTLQRAETELGRAEGAAAWGD